MYVCMYVCMYVYLLECLFCVGDGGCAWVSVCVAAGGAPYDDVQPGHGSDRARQPNDVAPPACRYHVGHTFNYVSMYYMYVCGDCDTYCVKVEEIGACC